MDKQETRKDYKFVVNEDEVLLPATTAADGCAGTPTPDSPQAAQAAAAARRNSPLKTFALFVVALGLTYCFMRGGANLSALGMDWGYYTIGAWIGQPTGNEQGLGAGYLTALAAPAVFGGAAIAFLKGTLGGNWRWRAAVPLLPLLGCFVSDWPNRCPTFKELVDVLPYLAGVWIVAVCLSIAFDFLYQELAQRVRAGRLLSSLLIALLPAAFLPDINSGTQPHNLALEVGLYCGLLFLAAAWAPVSIKAWKRPAALSAAIMALLPVTAFCVINVVFAAVCGAAGKTIGLDLGWQALASATLILAATGGATACGAGCGWAAAHLMRRPAS